ncbi:MAG TPA: ABC transporter ATP-binding protein, partial [candidate division WOR-3 bacterium]|nr:ABC transporter ATP-binding protein [candidate division WOR-3 bacterium]
MIEIKNLRKQFPGTDAIDGVTLNIPDGVVVGLAGPN